MPRTDIKVLNGNRDYVQVNTQATDTPERLYTYDEYGNQGGTVVAPEIQIKLASGPDGAVNPNLIRDVQQTLEPGADFMKHEIEYVLEFDDDTSIQVVCSDSDAHLLAYKLKVENRKNDTGEDLPLSEWQSKVENPEAAKKQIKELAEQDISSGLSKAEADGSEIIDLSQIPLHKDEKLTLKLVFMATLPLGPANYQMRIGRLNPALPQQVKIKNNTARPLLDPTHTDVHRVLSDHFHNTQIQRKENLGLHSITPAITPGSGDQNEIVVNTAGTDVLHVPVAGINAAMAKKVDDVECFKFPDGAKVWQFTLPAGEFKAKTEEVILIPVFDTSYSMEGDGITDSNMHRQMLNDGLYAAELLDGVKIHDEGIQFSCKGQAKTFRLDDPEPLNANGLTEYCGWLDLVNKMVARMDPKTPIIIQVVTDGMPQDEVEFKLKMAELGPRYPHVMFHFVGIGSYVNVDVLKQLSVSAGENRGAACRLNSVSTLFTGEATDEQVQSARHECEHKTRGMFLTELIPAVKNLANWREGVFKLKVKDYTNNNYTLLTCDGKAIPFDEDGAFLWQPEDSQIAVFSSDGSTPEIVWAKNDRPPNPQQATILDTLNTQLKRPELIVTDLAPIEKEITTDTTDTRATFSALKDWEPALRELPWGLMHDQLTKLQYHVPGVTVLVAPGTDADAIKKRYKTIHSQTLSAQTRNPNLDQSTEPDLYQNDFYNEPDDDYVDDASVYRSLSIAPPSPFTDTSNDNNEKVYRSLSIGSATAPAMPPIQQVRQLTFTSLSNTGSNFLTSNFISKPYHTIYSAEVISTPPMLSLDYIIKQLRDLLSSSIKEGYKDTKREEIKRIFLFVDYKGAAGDNWLKIEHNDFLTSLERYADTKEHSPQKLLKIITDAMLAATSTCAGMAAPVPMDQAVQLPYGNDNDNDKCYGSWVDDDYTGPMRFRSPDSADTSGEFHIYTETAASTAQVAHQSLLVGKATSLEEPPKNNTHVPRKSF